MAQMAITTAPPKSGRRNQSSLSFFIKKIASRKEREERKGFFCALRPALKARHSLMNPTPLGLWKARLGSRLQIVHREVLRVFLRFGGIKLHAVEQRLRLVVRAAVRAVDFLHRFLVDVRTHDLPGVAVVLDRARS